jgi:hypothetical protein
LVRACGWVGSADKDHQDVDQPHGEGKEDLGIAEVGWADGGLGDERPDEQAGCHARKTEEEGPEGDLVRGFERWERRESWRFPFEAALLDEIEQRCKQREEKRGIGGQKESHMKKDPAGLNHGKGRGLLAGVEGWNETQQEADGQEEDAERYGLVSPVDEQEGNGEKKAEKRLGFVGIDGQTVVSGTEHFDQRDEVKEDGGDGRRDGQMTPAWTVVKGRGKYCQSGNTVEDNCDFEPKERHQSGFASG